MRLPGVRAALGMAFLTAHCGGRSALDVELDGTYGGDPDGEGGSREGRRDGGSDGDAGDDGSNDDGEPAVVSVGDASVLNENQIVAGEAHACLRTKKGQVACWGSNRYGQLGDGTTDDRAVAKPVDGLGFVVAVSAGARHSCALLGDQSVWCWGSNVVGELGIGAASGPKTSPQRVPVNDAVGISSGGWHTCTNSAAGQVTCWGRNFNSETGSDTSRAPVLTPRTMSALSGATRLGAGAAHTCALVPGGALKCWGLDADGQLGNGDSSGATADPVDVLSVRGAVDLAAGDDHTCAVLGDGEVYCWGDGFLGELGDGRGTTTDHPVAVRGLGDAVRAAAGLEHTCAVRRTGEAACWGKAHRGQLGDGDALYFSVVPVPVAHLKDATDIATGDAFSCAAHGKHSAACWGDNLSGQLGNGEMGGNSGIPVEVQGL